MLVWDRPDSDNWEQILAGKTLVVNRVILHLIPMQLIWNWLIYANTLARRKVNRYPLQYQKPWSPCQKSFTYACCPIRLETTFSPLCSSLSFSKSSFNIPHSITIDCFYHSSRYCIQQTPWLHITFLSHNIWLRE